jgi:hypothetical protein
LKNNTSITSATVIGISWNDGNSNGGAAIIDYSVYFDSSTSAWTLLKEGV